MSYKLLELLHTTTGKTYYCYEHWPRNGHYIAVVNIPSNKTQVTFDLPLEECVVTAILPDPLEKK